MTSRKSKTALVVATTYLIASAIESPLKKSGFRVVVARDDEKALEALASQNVHLAIIDFRLQHRQPDGLAAHLEACSIPYIFCTAASPEEVAKHFPVASVIEQPFRDDQLVRVVSELVGR